MIHIHKSDLYSLLSLVVGVAALASDATFSSLLNARFGEHTATVVLLVISILGIVAAQMIRVLNAPAGQKVDAQTAATDALEQILALIKAQGPTPVHVTITAPAAAPDAPRPPSSPVGEQPIQGAAPAAAVPGTPAAPPQGAP